jgi:hypothetical protein
MVPPYSGAKWIRVKYLNKLLRFTESSAQGRQLTSQILKGKATADAAKIERGRHAEFSWPLHGKTQTGLSFQQTKPRFAP